MRRAESGNILRSVDTPIVAGPTSVSTAGVSTNANGLAGGSGFGAGGGIVTQVGPSPPGLDPGLAFGVSLGHYTIPLSNTVLQPDHGAGGRLRLGIRAVLPDVHHGASAALTFYENRTRLNSSTPLENPALTGYFDLTINQRFCKDSAWPSTAAISRWPATT